ncbi:hypothetical protein F5B21DRAFT_477078 [Xylaria acuta]|nr:hypothetical protein F5B21DRAFT_477078 [Xylaria acuta]
MPRRGPSPAVTGLLMYSYAVHPHGFRRHILHALVRLQMTAACFDLFAPILKMVPSYFVLQIPEPLAQLPSARNRPHQGAIGSGSCRDLPPGSSRSPLPTLLRRSYVFVKYSVHHTDAGENKAREYTIRTITMLRLITPEWKISAVARISIHDLTG